MAKVHLHMDANCALPIDTVCTIDDDISVDELDQLLEDFIRDKIYAYVESVADERELDGYEEWF